MNPDKMLATGWIEEMRVQGMRRWTRYLYLNKDTVIRRVYVARITSGLKGSMKNYSVYYNVKLYPPKDGCENLFGLDKGNWVKSGAENHALVSDFDNYDEAKEWSNKVLKEMGWTLLDEDKIGSML